MVPGNGGYLFPSHNVSTIWVLLLSGSAGIIHRESLKYLKGLGHADPTRIDAVKKIHEISKGLAYLHGQGVLHGDLKVRIPAVKSTISRDK